MSKKMLTRIITAVCVIAVVFPPIAFGGLLMRALEVFVAVMGGYELSRLFSDHLDVPLTVLNIASVALIGLVGSAYFPAALTLLAVLLFAIVIFDDKRTVKFACLTFTLAVILGMTVRTVDTLYYGERVLGWKAMLYVLLATFVTDTGAYFFGVFFGKHKMIPRISPNKTWEGAVGGYFSGLVVSMIFGLAVLKAVPAAMIICGSILLPVVAQIGDLSYSAIKRHFGIKDFGNLLPGHGGVLDRIDSMTFCLIVFYALMLVWGI